MPREEDGEDPWIAEDPLKGADIRGPSAWQCYAERCQIAWGCDVDNGNCWREMVAHGLDPQAPSPA